MSKKRFSNVSCKLILETDLYKAANDSFFNSVGGVSALGDQRGLARTHCSSLAFCVPFFSASSDSAGTPKDPSAPAHSSLLAREELLPAAAWPLVKVHCGRRGLQSHLGGGGSGTPIHDAFKCVFGHRRARDAGVRAPSARL